MLSGCRVRPVPPPDATEKYGLPAVRNYALDSRNDELALEGNRQRSEKILQKGGRHRNYQYIGIRHHLVQIVRRMNKILVELQFTQILWIPPLVLKPLQYFPVPHVPLHDSPVFRKHARYRRRPAAITYHGVFCIRSYLYFHQIKVFHLREAKFT